MLQWRKHSLDSGLEVVGKADIHVHSACGDGMASVSEILAYADRQTDLSVVAITDHDSLKGGFAAREAWARGKYRVEVIAGEEVTTLQGHLIALFLEEPVASLRPLQETLEAVHRQGGLCIIPHPLNWLTRSIGHRTIVDVQRRRGSGVYFDAHPDRERRARLPRQAEDGAAAELGALPFAGGRRQRRPLPAGGRKRLHALRRRRRRGPATRHPLGHDERRQRSLSVDRPRSAYGQFLRQQWRGIAGHAESGRLVADDLRASSSG